MANVSICKLNCRPESPKGNLAAESVRSTVCGGGGHYLGDYELCIHFLSAPAHPLRHHVPPPPDQRTIGRFCTIRLQTVRCSPLWAAYVPDWGALISGAQLFAARLFASAAFSMLHLHFLAQSRSCREFSMALRKAVGVSFQFVGLEAPGAVTICRQVTRQV